MSHGKLTRNIMVSLITGVVIGYFFPFLNPYVSWLGLVFKLSLAMIVMPIVFTSILDGMASIGDIRHLGQLGSKTLFYYLITTLMAVVLGLLIVVNIKPGIREIPHALAGSAPQITKAMSIHQFALEQINKALANPFEALADKNVLAVIIFAVLLGASLTTLGQAGQDVFKINRTINLAITKIVNLIMAFAPIGVFGLIVDVVSTTGIEVFQDLSWYALCILLGLATHLFIILPTFMYLLSGFSPFKFFVAMRPAMAVAFSTSSSNATLPISYECVEDNLKVDRRISRFVLSLGATMNMNGTALYEAVAAVFIAQLYGIHLDVTSQIIIALTASLAAIGAAGIPAAGMVTMAMVLQAAGLPLEGIGLLLVIDRPLDMCRTVVNVVGDGVVSVILSTKKRVTFN